MIFVPNWVVVDARSLLVELVDEHPECSVHSQKALGSERDDAYGS